MQPRFCLTELNGIKRGKCSYQWVACLCGMLFMPLSNEGYISSEVFNKMIYLLETVPVVTCRKMIKDLVMSERKILKLTVERAFQVFVLLVCLKPMFCIIFLLYGILHVFTNKPLFFFFFSYESDFHLILFQQVFKCYFRQMINLWLINFRYLKFIL